MNSINYTLVQELLYKKTGELISKVTVGNLMGRDLKFDSMTNNPTSDPPHTIISYQVVYGTSDSSIITKYQSIPWKGCDDIKNNIEKTNHKVTVYLYDENNVEVDTATQSENSNNAKDADDE